MRYVILTISAAFCLLLLPQDVGATAYYIDFSAAGGGNGLATTTAFGSLDAFTEAARSAGDIAFVRRGQASTTNVSTLTFTSDGTLPNPIVISADYDNLWSDFSTSSQTYTVAAGTTTLIASAATDVTAGQWIYLQGDCAETYNASSFNACEYAYEVETVSGTLIDLYLPYKGKQTGSGNNLRIMPAAPQWNAASGAFSITPGTDNFWLIKGLDLRGTNAGIVVINATDARGWEFNDTVFICNGSGDQIFTLTVPIELKLTKTRSQNCEPVFNPGGSAAVWATIKDSYFDLSNISGASFLDTGSITTGQIFFYIDIQESFLLNATDMLTQNLTGTDDELELLLARNLNYSSNITTPYGSISSTNGSFVFEEDADGTLGANAQYSWLSHSNTIPVIQSTSTVRSGGGASAAEVNPSSDFNTIGSFNRVKLFEYPIYTDTTSRQYDVYFRVGTSTTEWTTDPTSSELWVECDYWAHATNATSTRTVKKSTGVLDFNGSTAWQSLSVTCQPTQTGILYLRGWYAKTKEAGQSNTFLIDNTPVITP